MTLLLIVRMAQTCAYADDFKWPREGCPDKRNRIHPPNHGKTTRYDVFHGGLKAIAGRTSVTAATIVVSM
jgi:hypothetical protein